MRVKTDARRQAIVSAAIEVFRELGYERASMAAISARVGGSKATLYSYFKSKEELFAEAMLDAVDSDFQPLVDLLVTSEEDLPVLLRRLGLGYVRLMRTPHALAITRTAVAEGANAKLGALLYERGPRQGLDEIAAYMERLIDQKRIRPVDPRIAALHLKGLLDAGNQEPLLFGAAPELDIDECVDAAVDTFLRAYATA
ncbi:TetR/AcrR family transcriptional regulator [Novosphingobium sp.]|uniref:TetR/AcrR family transcriptional regulator n=1 Tax=Novosphingobium sp. TaxID=1874826 RepID=UPI0027347E3D|nr:TetR/AcrR family transcriptional regulator [Novosphingobium sp.]MDP3907558.1 TetR/AcrR family transcriptional regulator [Novosphingobium sp.]